MIVTFVKVDTGLMQALINNLKVILGVSWVISGGRYDDGPPPWGIMGVEENPP